MCTFAISTEFQQLFIKKIIPSLPPDSIFENSYTILSKMLGFLMGEGEVTLPRADAEWKISNMENLCPLVKIMHKL